MPAAIIEVTAIILMIVVLSFIQKDIKISKFFVNSPAFMITFGGTFVASLLHFSTKDILNSIGFLKQVFIKEQIYPERMVNIVIELSSVFKEKGREGLKIIKKDITHPILLTGLDLLSATDLEEGEFEELFQVSIKRSFDNHKKHEKLFGEMGVYAPMFGLLGTLIGLIQLLKELADPKTIAPNMAIALITTLYGIALAGFIFMPISGKIKTKGERELINSEIIFNGLSMIKKGYGPFTIEQKLKAYV